MGNQTAERKEEKLREARYKKLNALKEKVLGKALSESIYFHAADEETDEQFMVRLQAVKEAYNKALTSTPDPDTLHQPDWDNDDLTMEQRDQNQALNEATIQGWNDAAVKSRAWVGRTMMDGVGDGNAIYVVVKENKKTVRIKVCQGIGDDWVSRHFGEDCSVDKVQACSFFGWSFHKKTPLPYDMQEA